MTPDHLREYCLSLPGAVFVRQWGDDQVYKISGKMFAVTDSACSRISFKCSEEAFLMLTEASIAQPAPYLARARWVQVAEGAMPDNELCQRLRQAYSIVRAGLTRKAQAALLPFDG
ncbi:MmcQ/YjbR family DNA-binding protein [Hyphomonas sp. WL0036]|uniref:MmcQ/YjbR family DNA-binding protein n=1 Tax=Hyphomonas sediminis TaxID=2866160 RepID=UPI001C80BC9C|nr:MmcQ/YjbR family DNA-binding protein [Hyphomonas sediminis]MBY9068337.1 MmcQ/YjbR family DNA-binding protein [Hyphomonas sediminis]